MKLEPTSELIPASYNPRDVDEERLNLIALSIRKLGWLLPVYAAEGGEILSGHQRTFIASRIGYDQAPVIRISGDMPDKTRRAINILFNRSTNDMDFETRTEEMADALKHSDIIALGESLPDHPRDDFPCMDAEELEIAPFVKANRGRWITYCNNVSKSLRRHGVMMPVVVDQDGIVVNGIGRLQMAAEKKLKTYRFVRISNEKAEFARAMLNKLSMDFAIEKHYSDMMRYNSFRRIRRSRNIMQKDGTRRVTLGRGFLFPIIQGEAAHTFDVRKAESRRQWVKLFGSKIVDFGAGHLQETDLLRSVGVDVTPFEPYRLDPSGETEEISKDESQRVCREFLEAVRTKKQFTSIFIASVLNSIPFASDREHVVRICAAIASSKTTCYAVASSDKHIDLKNLKAKFLNQRMEQLCKMVLNYEENVMMGDMQDKPKVQRYHTPEQFYDLFKTSWGKVQVRYDTSTNVAATAKDPLPVDPVKLRETIEFEFDLPYPDGSTLGLVDEALEAFSARLEIDLR